jgi:hypothetical protein
MTGRQSTLGDLVRRVFGGEQASGREPGHLRHRPAGTMRGAPWMRRRPGITPLEPGSQVQRNCDGVRAGRWVLPSVTASDAGPAQAKSASPRDSRNHFLSGFSIESSCSMPRRLTRKIRTLREPFPRRAGGVWAVKLFNDPLGSWSTAARSGCSTPSPLSADAFRVVADRVFQQRHVDEMLSRRRLVRLGAPPQGGPAQRATALSPASQRARVIPAAHGACLRRPAGEPASARGCRRRGQAGELDLPRAGGISSSCRNQSTAAELAFKLQRADRVGDPLDHVRARWA